MLSNKINAQWKSDSVAHGTAVSLMSLTPLCYEEKTQICNRCARGPILSNIRSALATFKGNIYVKKHTEANCPTLCL
jgi:hypothetical protein